uniref:Sphingomyelin synthase-related protein 1 n=1 Tax=Hydra vulgaris TaxID=6087 RepID=T2M797_HYDVU
MKNHLAKQKPVHTWTISDVGEWLCKNGFSQYKELFCDKHKIDGLALITLTIEDLRQPPVQIPVLGDIKRILAKIKTLRSENSCFDSNASPKGKLNLKKLSVSQSSSSCSDEDEINSFSADCTDYVNPRKMSPLEEDMKNAVVSVYFRTFVSFIYMLAVFLLASFTLAVVHDRLPNTSDYPPLPDVFLEAIPFMPWAFYLCEVCGSIMLFFWCIIIIFHKHRLVVFRRSCALAGTIFLFRCFTMYVTSLSVPGKHLDCSPTKYGTFYNRLIRALEIFTGCGMALQGVRTCGDYMFSGHTATLTLLNFFVNEYTPRRWYYLHTFCWLLNIFGIFFILAAHEHYSIDVLISFYITSRLFMYYHTLASAVQISPSDDRRRRFWFPLFWFFEYGGPLVIKNEFECLCPTGKCWSVKAKKRLPILVSTFLLNGGLYHINLLF